MALPCLRAAAVPSPWAEPRKLPPLSPRRGVIIAEKLSLEQSRNHQPHLKNAISRRDAMSCCMVASLVGNFLVTEPAQAGRIKPETRRKIREKLDKMREKGGVPNKPDSGAENKEEKPPALLNKMAGPLVEATFLLK